MDGKSDSVDIWINFFEKKLPLHILQKDEISYKNKQNKKENYVDAFKKLELY